MLSYEFIQFIDERVMEHLPPGWRRIGNKLHGRCPICGDSHKSKTKARGWFYLSTGSYYCFNCGCAMSGIKFLEAVAGYDYAEIKKEYIKLFLKSGINPNLSAWCGDKPDAEPSMFDLKPMVKPEWKNSLTDAAKDYLSKRHVLDAPFYHDDLYSWTSPKGKEYILIDWVLNGVDAYFQLNDFQKHGNLKYIFPKDSRKLVAGLDAVDVCFPYIFVFEGFYDSLFVKNGICTGTKSINDCQLKLIKDRYPHHQVVVSFDNDVPGIAAMAKLMSKDNDFKYFKWFNRNTKEKDINDYVLAKGNVNTFADPAKLEKLVADKLMMKMHLIQNGLWVEAEQKKATYGSSPRREAREVQRSQNWNVLSAIPAEVRRAATAGLQVRA